MDDGWLIIISAEKVGMNAGKRWEKPLNKGEGLSDRSCNHSARAEWFGRTVIGRDI